MADSGGDSSLARKVLRLRQPSRLHGRGKCARSNSNAPSPIAQVLVRLDPWGILPLQVVEAPAAETVDDPMGPGSRGE